MFDFKNASKVALARKYQKIAKEIGDDQFFTRKELAYLQEMLTDKEQVLAFTSGMMDGNTWLIALTDRRIVFLDKGLIYGLEQTIINLDKVNAVSGKTGLLFGKITITDGAKDRTISNVLKKTVKPFVKKVQETIEASQAGAFQVAKKIDPYEQLEKLASLNEKGIISENEFVAAKKKILGTV